MQPIFITGTGTGVGKTLIAAIITEALRADYWKPVQAGYLDGTDAASVGALISNKTTKIHPECYKLAMAASPHIAAKVDGITIKLKTIAANVPATNNRLIIEGAGGLLVPLNTEEFVLDLVKKLKAKVVIVSKNELGSINHSLTTAYVLRKEKVEVAGWIFTEEYLDYQQEISDWTGYPIIGSVPHLDIISRETIKAEALKMKKRLQKFL